MSPKTTILSVIGTRPEVIKLASLIRALEARHDSVRSLVYVTGQHRELLRQMLDFFQIRLDADFDLMRERQGLARLTGEILEAMQSSFERLRPDWVIVQGDTTTAMASALSAFYSGIKVAHVEAGLRTGNKNAPFPEEINRRIISTIADQHFAPTPAARDALLAEGHRPESIAVTGNSVIDALFWTRERARRGEFAAPDVLGRMARNQRYVLVTAHRRENFDTGMVEICKALQDIVLRHEDIVIVYPVHPNPNVVEPVMRLLSGIPRIELIAPLEYGPFVCLLDSAYLILTDSGGIQEEATALGKPIVVLRDLTERPEAVANGNAVLTGATRSAILEAANSILTDAELYRRMARPSSIFGDGRAGERMAEALLNA